MTSIDTRPVTEKRGFAFLRLRERPLKPRSGAVTEVGDSRASRGLGSRQPASEPLSSRPSSQGRRARRRRWQRRWRTS